MERGNRNHRVNVSAFCALVLLLVWVPGIRTAITCRSCQLFDKWSGRELLVRMDGSISSTTGSVGKVIDNNEDGSMALSNSTGAETGQLVTHSDCAADGEKCAHYERKRNTDLHLNKAVEGKMPPYGQQGSMDSHGKVSNPERAGLQVVRTGSVPVDLKRRVRRGAWESVMSTDAPRARVFGNGSLRAARRVPRSDLRWNREDRRPATSRQEDLKLTSSTFALTGDSAHNQAMVHWSGQNSSVSEKNTQFVF